MRMDLEIIRQNTKLRYKFGSEYHQHVFDKNDNSTTSKAMGYANDKIYNVIMYANKRHVTKRIP